MEKYGVMKEYECVCGKKITIPLRQKLEDLEKTGELDNPADHKHEFKITGPTPPED